MKKAQSNRFKSVWDALEDTHEDAVNMTARSEIMMAVRNTIDAWSMTQADAAARLGITQPRMNDLLRGRIDKFSSDALLKLAQAAGLSVTWQITQRAA